MFPGKLIGTVHRIYEQTDTAGYEVKFTDKKLMVSFGLEQSAVKLIVVSKGCTKSPISYPSLYF